MKKMLLTMAAVAMVAGDPMAWAQSQTVTSVNVVGYYSVTIPAGKLALVTPVLESFNQGTVADLIGNQLPVNSAIWIWDRENKEYKSGSYISVRGGAPSWTGAAVTFTNLVRGDAFWVSASTDGTKEQYSINVLGEVPYNYNDGEASSVAYIDVADAVGYPYPIDIEWTSTKLSEEPAISTLYIWDVEEQKYTSVSRNPRSGEWLASPIIKAGSAFWVTGSGSGLVWDETVPYSLED